MTSTLVFYGSYRSDRMGIRLANYIVKNLLDGGVSAELIDAKALGLPMLDRMYKEHAPGTAPAPLEALAAKIKAADAFLFVVGEYNWGVQPIASYSAGRLAGARANLAWHGILSEMGMVVISSTLMVGPIGEALDANAVPAGAAGKALENAFPRFAADLAWWTAAAKAQRAKQAPPY
jgi:NAD(P)H-dependent FMN reductase